MGDRDAPAVLPLMKHWRKMYENKYLGAWNLYNDQSGKYGEAGVTIARVQWEVITGEKGRKDQSLVLYFAGKKTPMILSKRNGKTLESMHGADPAGWVGKRITLYVRDEKVKGQAAKVLTVRGASRAEELREELAAPEVPEFLGDDGGSDDPDKGP